MKEPRNGMSEFYDLLEEMANTHHKKSHDYASNQNPAGNYHFAGKVAALFNHSPQDAGFAGRIAEKIYRIANLEASGKPALNETIEDTETDVVTITALWMADRRRRRKLYTLTGTEEAIIGWKPKNPNPPPPREPRSTLGQIDTCNVHDKYEIGCVDCRRINGIE